MSQIILVRHGQASFLVGDYDKLCANGQVQSRLLGEYWSRRAVLFSRAYSGPRARHLDTAQIVAEAYRGSGVVFPEMTVMDEFDEYHAEPVMQACLTQLLPRNAEINALHHAYTEAAEPAEQHRTFQKLFEAVITKWVAGEVAADGIPTWDQFCLRVGQGVTQVVRSTPSAASAVVFTSAGPIGAAMRRALHLSASDTLQLTWMSRNASFSTFLASGERFTLSAFNAHPHLDGDGLLTYR